MPRLPREAMSRAAMLALAGQRLNRTGIDGDAEPARRGHNRHCVLPRGSPRRAAPVLLGQPRRSARTPAGQLAPWSPVSLWRRPQWVPANQPAGHGR